MPRLVEVYTPRESQLAIIAQLESDKDADPVALAEAYKKLTHAHEVAGDFEAAQQAVYHTRIATVTDALERQQLYIDRMEEMHDVDVATLARAYENLGDMHRSAGDMNACEEAEANAQALQNMLTAAPSQEPRFSPRATPRSERAAAGGVADSNGSPVWEQSPAPASPPQEEEEEEQPRPPVVHRLDSASSPIITRRPVSSQGGSRGGSRAGIASSSSITESKSGDAAADAAAASPGHKGSGAGYGDDDEAGSPGAKDGDIASMIKSLRFTDGPDGPRGAQEKETAAAVGYDDDYDDYLDDFADEKDDTGTTTAEELQAQDKHSLSTASAKELAPTPLPKSKKPMLFLVWDGEQDSYTNVNKLIRMLKAKGYVVFEHAGGDCTGSAAPLQGFDPMLLKSGSQMSLDLDGGDSLASMEGLSTFTEGVDMAMGAGAGVGTGTVGISCAEGSGSLELSAQAGGVDVTTSSLTAGSLTTGSVESSATGLSMGSSARARVSQEIVDKMSVSTVFVACVTRNFTMNLNCKKLVLRMRELQMEIGKKSAEMLYTMVHGTFTTESQPYHCRDGWLGYLLRDSLWSPAWSHAHVAGAAEAIAGTVALRRSVVRLKPEHILYIDSRGREGVCPPCFTKPR